jgi:LacI family purine nucleotide synthesis repressor
MSVTLKDIAKIANVSHTTVSRALNNSPFISAQTRERIMALVRELNYSPNISAKSLVTSRTYNIALFFSSLTLGTTPNFFYETVEGAYGVLKGNYNLVVQEIAGPPFSNVNKNRFDGIILISQSEEDDGFIADVLEKGIPLVVLNREIAEGSVANILADDKIGAYDATKYLIGCGHTDIAVIKGKEGFKSTLNRAEGYSEALAEGKIRLNAGYMAAGSYDLESGFVAMKELLRQPKAPTAVFCSNDDMAVGAMKAIFEAGLRVPGDISIIGFDDSVICGYVTPALTSVRKPSRELSEKGAKKLVGMIEGREPAAGREFIKADLVLRESVSRIS